MEFCLPFVDIANSKATRTYNKVRSTIIYIKAIDTRIRLVNLLMLLEPSFYGFVA